ncbi:M1 family metallopeptidase [Scleromatobacter humisilvae]|uniref:Aminopeptidase n=1 Tax=Scleromatobacter humisilvae TaxID=2897159 RepID=A0A9X2BXG6_9BURK|nr:M1 family metallopeptidase [Scleromatobacter humisilvae]MCK9684543.1 M1 family metallopeptidase [Scleromatobacter humisilvae]
MQKILPRFVLGVLACFGAHAMAATANRMILPDDVLPEAYRIAITPHADQATFDGTVEIDVQVRRRTDRIVLDSADLAIAGATLDAGTAAPSIALDAGRERATFTFAHAIPLGRHTLRIVYSGKINDQASGLFKLQHATPQGPVTSLYTMFEDSDARRFVPSWDEPARRATFDLTVTVPAELMAVGNMPIASSEALPGNLKRVRFATTPKMSTYLLFFGLGDFERVHREVAGVDVGVIVKRGDTAQAAYALDAAARILPYYNAWFGTPYPLPKLDMVAGAGGSVTFGAMENWGAIFYFERDLLIDDKLASQEDKHRVFETIAHEVAHQWFGDLVTMAWWDDLWLNEGFASWMEVKATQELHPEWAGWPQVAARKQQALDIDARRGTHPVIMRIDDVTQTEGAFDTITYAKGSQVVRTLEATMGDDAFRDGVRRYIAAHAYGNTVTDDLWRSLDAHAARPVRAIARDLTLQPGVPLIVERDARCVDGRTVATLSQQQFSVGAPRVAQWHAPVALQVLGGGSARAVIAGAAPQRVSVDGCGPLVINAGQASYLRVRYSDAGLAALAQRFPQLSADDRLGLLADTQALALAGQLPMGAWLGLMRQVPAQQDPLVIRMLIDQLTDLDNLHAGLPSRPAFRVFARGLLAPIFASVGWQPAEGEAGDIATLRVELILALGTFDDAAVVAEAQRRFERFQADHASLQGDALDAVLKVIAIRADARAWETLHALAKAAPTELEKARYYELLGYAHDPDLAQRALTLAVSGEPPETIAGRLLRSIGVTHPAATLDFVSAHWAAVEPLFGDGAGATIAARFFDTGADRAMLPKLDAFVAAHVPAATRGRIVKNAALIGYRATVRDERLPQAGRWIATQ